MTIVLNSVLLNALVATGLALLVWTVAMIPAVRRRPGLRHVLWLIVLLKLVTPPVLEVEVLPASLVAEAERPAHPRTIPLSVIPRDDRAESPAVPSGPIPLEIPQTVPPARRIDWMIVLAIVSPLGTLTVLLLAIKQIWRFRRTLARGASNDERMGRITRQSAHQMGLSVPPPVCIVSAKVSPLLWVRCRRPVVVMPRQLIDRMSDEQLACVVSHEIAHYLRRDHWTNLLSMLVAAICWWNPVVWWARRELRTAQETCCDALVISRSVAARRMYAETVFQALEFIEDEGALSPALASGFGGKSSTRRRFEMIANPRVSHRLSWWSYPVLLAALAILPCAPAFTQALKPEDQVVSKSDARTQQLLEVEQRRWKLLVEKYRAGRAELQDLVPAANDLLEARLDTALSDDARQTILQDHLAMWKDLEQIAKAQYRVGSAGQADVLLAQSQALKAERQLAAETPSPATAIGKADSGTHRGEIAIVGMLEYDESRMARIHCRLNGRVEKVLVDFLGLQVKKGDALIELYSPELYTAQHEFLVAREAGKDSEVLKTAIKAAVERLRLLGVPTPQIEQLEQQAEPTGQVALYAPIDGIITDKLVQAGERVEDGDHLLTIADPTRLHATFHVPMSEIRHLRLGQQITLTVEGLRDRAFPGENVFIDPRVSLSRTIKVVAAVANEQGELKPGMFAQVFVTPAPVDAGQKEAGEPSGPGQEPAGTVLRVDTKRVGNDLIVELECLDGANLIESAVDLWRRTHGDTPVEQINLSREGGKVRIIIKGKSSSRPSGDQGAGTAPEKDDSSGIPGSPTDTP